jgi:NADP-dependent 3-hydroxy acid dehydrogenase YdfG
MTNKVVMVSGANRGIGKAIVKSLVRKGYTLSVGIRNPSAMEGFGGLVCPFDAMISSSAEEWVNKTIDTFGRIDALVNNAGLVKKITFDGYTSEEDSTLKEMWKINSVSPLLLSKLCSKYLYKSDLGRIIHISSMSGKRVGNRDKNMGYAMSKFSLMAVSEAISLEGVGDIEGVRSTVICPGYVKVERNTQAILDKNIHSLKPEDIADVVSFLLELPKRVVIPEICVVPCSQI